MDDLMKRLRMRSISALCYALLVLTFMAGCMNVRGSETINSAPVAKEQFAKRTVAVLPVKEQAALTTDSLLSLRVALNENLDNKIKEKLPDSKIMNTKTTVDILNSKGKLGLMDEIMRTYEGTGVFDKRMIESLCDVLKSDYVVFSRLKAEKMAVGFISKGFGASIEVAILRRSQQDIVWGGAGEYKRGGIFGLGTTENKEAAKELIQLAFEKF